MKHLKNDWPLWLVIAIPFAYLGYIWPELPHQVPMQWNLDGEVSRYGNKAELILIPFVLPVLVYLLMIVIPAIDPKRKLRNMGRKYNQLKVVMTVLMSLLACYIIYTAQTATMANGNLAFLLIGALYIVLGNYFKTIRPNYFIGIRTPWTLENEAIWKATHRMAGAIWLVGGILVVLATLLLPLQMSTIVLIGITVALVLIPGVYSYLQYRRLSNNTSSEHPKTEEE